MVAVYQAAQGLGIDCRRQGSHVMYSVTAPGAGVEPNFLLVINVPQTDQSYPCAIGPNSQLGARPQPRPPELSAVETGHCYPHRENATGRAVSEPLHHCLVLPSAGLQRR